MSKISILFFNGGAKAILTAVYLFIISKFIILLYYNYSFDNYNLNIIKLLTCKYKFILFKNSSNYSLFKWILNNSL